MVWTSKSNRSALNRKRKARQRCRAFCINYTSISTRHFAFVRRTSARTMSVLHLASEIHQQWMSSAQPRVHCFVLNRGNWRGRRDLDPRPQPWQGYDTGPTDFAQLREISTKLRNFNMIVWSITQRSGASGITFGIPSGPGSACGKRTTPRPSRTVETSQWRCISGVEWHCHQEPRRLRR